jgi:hypothetical protein
MFHLTAARRRAPRRHACCARHSSDSGSGHGWGHGSGSGCDGAARRRHCRSALPSTSAARRWVWVNGEYRNPCNAPRRTHRPPLAGRRLGLGPELGAATLASAEAVGDGDGRDDLYAHTR